MRHAVLSLTITFLLIFAGSVHAQEPQKMRKVPILVYHHIRETKPYPKSTWSYKMSVSPSVFESHMQWLKDRGYTTLTLDEAVDYLSGTADFSKPVVITFDDNNRSQYTIAFPVLKKLGQKGVFYFVANRLQNKGFILEDEVREMANAGMDIQSHSVTHATMTALNMKRLDEELLKSKTALELLTGKPVRHIAYPSTAQNKGVRARVALAGYRTATIMDPRPATGTDDLFRLPRIMMTDDTNLLKLLP